MFFFQPDQNRMSLVRSAAATAAVLMLIATIATFINEKYQTSTLEESKAGDKHPGREQSLHYGMNYFQHEFGVSGRLNHHWWCGHYFRSLCRSSLTREDDSTPWFQKTDWLDYSAKLAVISPSLDCCICEFPLHISPSNTPCI